MTRIEPSSETPTPSALMPEAGKRYVLRNGEIVGPIYRGNHVTWPWEDGKYCWRESGRHLRGKLSPFDMIAEAPPAPLVYDLEGMNMHVRPGPLRVDMSNLSDLRKAFYWAETPQGHDYWRRIVRTGHTAESRQFIADMLAQQAREMGDVVETAAAPTTSDLKAGWEAIRILNSIGMILETNGYAHMTNGDGIASILATLTAERDEARAALEPLKRIADAFDANELDDHARRFWGSNPQTENKIPHDQIELFSGRGGELLLTLEQCDQAREVLTKVNAT